MQGWEDAFCFEQFVISFGASGERKNAVTVGVEIGQGEHFATDDFVSNPEDEIVAPRHGLLDVREGKQEFANGFYVHNSGPGGRTHLVCRL